MESIILGTIQGIAEWLPVSSEGLLVLAQVGLFESSSPLQELIRISLFLHFGTFLAALVYFRRDVVNILLSVLKRKEADKETKKITNFLVLATLVSGLVGFGLLEAIEGAEERLELGGKAIMGMVGVLLLFTAWIQLKTKSETEKSIKNLNWKDGILLGIVQGFAALPGVSRSGSTTGVLLLNRYDEELSLRLSFLMSLPIVLAGNIILNADMFTLSTNALLGLLASFIFGLATIHILLKIARKVNFGYFVLGFAILTLMAVFI
ncbi:MAG: undecaprenyl-diphosphate phosphatase [Candidatus Spechtbacterales bacterium]|nr:undecaprenyl-diphosphate phosphatase [Candidatus Spechtbacterales bacterium]